MSIKNLNIFSLLFARRPGKTLGNQINDVYIDVGTLIYPRTLLCMIFLCIQKVSANQGQVTFSFN